MKVPIAVVLAILGCFSPEIQAQGGLAEPRADVAPVLFDETWAYLLAGDGKPIDLRQPISDLALFSASLNSKGELAGIPASSPYAALPVRRHLVIAELSNSALIHFVLSPEYPMRERLLAQIAEAARGYDGVQIDFEAVPGYDAANFVSFLSCLRSLIQPRILSAALPARWKRVDDAYDYASISAVVDRVVVMAYDEHWSGSGPGSIASMDWCRRVAQYSLGTIGASK
ncbi:MAG TPA: glycosyl hydrolase family 18 protein, partial [Rectinemataceae bacterium]|nr:glycosyl hydrolase family 18 protein [Rectinemataceae bacterium]